jgi:hypothetical protein
MSAIMSESPCIRILVLALLTTLGGCSHPNTDEVLFVSCQNHRAHLNMDLTMELQGERKAQPPCEPNAPGYEMLARYAGRRQGYLNCNHGAPESRIGGWQAVNLPAQKWRDLQRMWSARDRTIGLPFYWCGKPNARQVRVFCTLWLDDRGVWFVDHDVVTEAELSERVRTLNRCLSELGLPPVGTDVPDGVRWASFDSQASR